MASVRPPSIPSFSAVLFACALSVHSGCALAIQAPEPERPRNEVPKCDTGKGLVAMDGLWGTLFGLSALGAFGGDEEGAGIALLGASALFFASAVRGNNAANSCRGAYEDYNAQLMRMPSGDMVAGPTTVVPRPAVKKKPKKTPPPPPPDETLEPQQVDPQRTADPEPVAPEYASPRPPTAVPVPAPAPAPPAKQPPATQKKPTPPPPPPPSDDEWGDFWKEVP